MGLIVDVQHMLHRKLGVTLRSGETLVTQHLLDGSQISSFFQHVSAEGMAQSMRVNVGR